MKRPVKKQKRLTAKATVVTKRAETGGKYTGLRKTTHGWLVNMLDMPLDVLFQVRVYCQLYLYILNTSMRPSSYLTCDQRIS